MNRKTVLAPSLAVLFILLGTALLYREAAPLDLNVSNLLLGSGAILGFLLLGMIYSAVSRVPMTSMISAVCMLLFVHNGYQFLFGGGSYVIYMILGMACLVLAFLFVRRWPQVPDLFFYILSGGIILLMLCNLLFGQALALDSSSRLWITVGGMSIQPGEFAKAGLLLQGALCYRNSKRFRIYLLTGAFTCLSLLMLRDIGNLAVLVAMFLLMTYLLYDNRLISAVLIGGFLVAFLALLAIFPYALDRFFSWGKAMTAEGNLQQRQIITSVVVAGVPGLGLADHAVFTSIYSASSDAALAGIQAVYGVPAVLVTMLLYSVLVIQAATNRSVYPSNHLILTQSALVIFCQVLLNYCGSLDILPFTGIVAPLISKGGSAMLTFCLILGACAGSMNPVVTSCVTRYSSYIPDRK